MKKIIVLIAILFTVFSCQKEERTLVYYVASERFDNPLNDILNKGVWLIAKDSPDDEWMVFHTRSVDGFDYERGYEYTIEVREVSLPEHTDALYPKGFELIKVISKVKADSVFPELLKENIYQE